MVGLADILPSSETVNVRGEDVEVTGIDLGDLFPLSRRFPTLSGMMGAFNLEQLLAQPRPVIGAVLAAGIGKLGDEAVERGLGNLKLGEKAALAAAILRQTSPGGVGPFVDLIAAAAGAFPSPTSEVGSTLEVPEDAVSVPLTRRSRKLSNGSDLPTGA